MHDSEVYQQQEGDEEQLQQHDDDYDRVNKNSVQVEMKSLSDVTGKKEIKFDKQEACSCGAVLSSQFPSLLHVLHAKCSMKSNRTQQQSF